LPGIALIGRSAAAQQAKITLGSGAKDSGLENYAAAFADAIKAVDPTFEVRLVSPKEILGNVSMLESGDLDIGLVFGEVAHDLFTGIGRPPTTLKVISVAYSTPGMFVVRAESRYRRIADLKGQPVVWNRRNSGIAAQARYVMDGLDLDIERDFEPIYTNRLSEGPPMVLEGRAAALWGSGLRWPGFVAIARDPRGARFVVPDSGEIARIQAKYGFLKKFTVPASLYPGQYDALYTVGGWSFILARANLDDSVGYRLASSLYKIDRYSAFSGYLKESTPKNTLAAIPGPEFLQPGVMRFYQKLNLLK
jgi:TRAP transporter TAXI family solute receptor